MQFTFESFFANVVIRRSATSAWRSSSSNTTTRTDAKGRLTHGTVNQGRTMTQTKVDAQFWRSTALVGYFWQEPPPPGTDADAYLYAKAEAVYIDQIGDGGINHKPFPRKCDAGALIAAVILLTYGRLDVVAAILELPLHPFAKVNSLRRSVWSLVPFPSDIHNLGDTKVAIAWVEANKERLHWDKEEGRFILSDSAHN
jgi:hypothetical protein